MKLRGKSNTPRRPPKILIVGAPGSGKSTLSKLIAAKFGLVYVSTAGLLNGEIANNTEVGKAAAQLMQEGQLISDGDIVKLIERRLSRQDCKTNGWILEGFPKTESQMNMLKIMKIPMYSALIPVSYTHLTLPTICSV
eukprot:TRINITY_DN11687_c0_g2_i1.p1 TRINITY_DN11687_c0_g2~~TRINITY_DN11687_c0_g2_i1.p1  ORF type:complete len:138 (-),score=35.01 TRINITY_DN11687_c0_g2_i1:36-449(-)